MVIMLLLNAADSARRVMPLSDFAIVNSVFGKLIADSTFLGYFGLTPSSNMADIVAKIQKEMEPTGLSANNIPLCCIYPIPGVRSRANAIVYDSMFEIAIYSNNSSSPTKLTNIQVGTMVIGDRARLLLHQVQLAGATFKVEFQTSFQTTSNIAGIKKYVMRFKVGEVIE